MNHVRSLLLATAIVLSAGLLPMGAQAAGSTAPEVRSEIEREMANARQEVRTELAKARSELDAENLSIDKGLQFGDGAKRKSADRHRLPAAHISPKGDFLVDGQVVAVNAQQRQQLLDYRGQIIEIAKVGIDAGEQAAMAALDATDVSMFRLIVGGLSGSLERRIEASVKKNIEPLVLQICQRLPQVLESQQELAASLPQFKPYANLERQNVADCERDIRKDLAMR